ncbi:MAG: hypothetical protein AB7U29_10215 [Desulfobulbus sp.]
MEPNGLFLATLIIGLLVLAMTIDHVTSDTLKHPDDADTTDTKRKGPQNPDY